MKKILIITTIATILLCACSSSSNENLFNDLTSSELEEITGYKASTIEDAWESFCYIDEKFTKQELLDDEFIEELEAKLDSDELITYYIYSLAEDCNSDIKNIDSYEGSDIENDLILFYELEKEILLNSLEEDFY